MTALQIIATVVINSVGIGVGVLVTLLYQRITTDRKENRK